MKSVLETKLVYQKAVSGSSTDILSYLLKSRDLEVGMCPTLSDLFSLPSDVTVQTHTHQKQYHSYVQRG